MRKVKVRLTVEELENEIAAKDAYIKYLEGRLQKYNKEKK